MQPGFCRSFFANTFVIPVKVLCKDSGFVVMRCEIVFACLVLQRGVQVAASIRHDPLGRELESPLARGLLCAQIRQRTTQEDVSHVWGFGILPCSMSLPTNLMD